MGLKLGISSMLFDESEAAGLLQGHEASEGES